MSTYKYYRITENIIQDINQGQLGEGEKNYFLFHRHRLEYIFSLLDEFNKNCSILNIGALFLHELLGAYFLGFRNLSGTDLSSFKPITAERAERIKAVIKDCDLEKEKLPFLDKTFDLVLLDETLEHFNFHPKKVFLEIARILKPGGRLIITTPNLVRLNNRLKCFLGKSINYEIDADYTTANHYREYTAAEIEYLLNVAGLKKAKLEYTDFDYPDRGRIERIVNKAAGAFSQPLKPNIVMIGKKD